MPLILIRLFFVYLNIVVVHRCSSQWWDNRFMMLVVRMSWCSLEASPYYIVYLYLSHNSHVCSFPLAQWLPGCHHINCWPIRQRCGKASARCRMHRTSMVPATISVSRGYPFSRAPHAICATLGYYPKCAPQ
jgi:hypothetical protein